MAYFIDGQRVENFMGMDNLFRHPKTGELIRSKEELLAKGGIPDGESLQEATALGYKGTDTSAEAIAKKQIGEWDTYSPIFEATDKDGNLLPQYKLDATEDMAGAKSAYSQALAGQDNLMSMAKDTEMTPYAKALMDMQALEEGKQRSDLAQQTGASIAAGQRVLGSTGGYDSGARERMLLGATRGQATGGQDIGRESAYSRLGIRSEDLDKKFNILTGAPTAYSNLSNVSKGIGQVGLEVKGANIDKAIADKRAQQAARDARFGKRMEVTGAMTESQSM